MAVKATLADVRESMDKFANRPVMMKKDGDPSADVALPEIARVITEADRIGILTHRRPDGDAIGSSLALAESLIALGKEVRLVNEDAVPDALRFLDGSRRFEKAGDLTEAVVVDLIIVVDAAGRDRVGDAAWDAFANRGYVINLDHHISNTRFGDLNHVVASAPATGQLIHQLITTRGWPMPEAARDALYVALSTDTGSFRFPSTGAETYRIAADLVDRGLDVGEMAQRLYESFPMRRLLLLRDLLRDMEIRDNGRTIAVRLTRSMAEAVGMREGDTEGLIDVIRSVDSVVVAVFFEEMIDGKIRVSSRSKTPRVDVGEICAVFGGGGHRLAAGARMGGPIDSAAERFLNEVATRLDGLD